MFGVSSIYAVTESPEERWKALIDHGILHSGDNDSTGAICYAWYGALYGFEIYVVQARSPQPIVCQFEKKFRRNEENSQQKEQNKEKSDDVVKVNRQQIDDQNVKWDKQGKEDLNILEEKENSNDKRKDDTIEDKDKKDEGGEY
ncbi:MAG: hypothetical protein EZS28_011194 [Streblomastix strix]|uniref:Uncharacterized protein n=1 Tax=Streblomastix strix TaxID=222440 RepID=A0A5J4WFY4_9EUKA|nr:MAG: hypothetical protein EZS28_011194 [Streblomastix strix]